MSVQSSETVSVVDEVVGRVPLVIAALWQVGCGNPESPHHYVTGLGQLHPEYALSVPSMCEDDKIVDLKVGAVSDRCWLIAVVLRCRSQGVQLDKPKALE